MRTFPEDELFLPLDAVDALLSALRMQGYRCHGPVVERGALVFRQLAGDESIARGWQAEQSPGRYTLTRDPQNRYFAWANGPQAIKPLVFSPHESLWRVARDAQGTLRFEALVARPEKIALIGVRACDLAALKLQDAHFMRGDVGDSHYSARRASLLLIAVQCAEPASTCFCASTGDGPVPHAGYDLSLTELPDGFVVKSGSEKGHEILGMLALAKATPAQVEAMLAQGEAAASRQARKLPSRDLQSLLLTRLEHPAWDEVATRCLSCGNCTAVCPTCFCHATMEEPGAMQDEVTHVRQWDSCFSVAHAAIHGYDFRPDTRSRYRQWLVHKLSAWHEQYGRSGCVGCGRCISWCPAGIDLTVEVAALTAGREEGS